MRDGGNTILITGGGSGIGLALADRLQARGDTIILAGRREDALVRAIGGRERMAAIPVDIADPASVETFAARVVAEHPALNVLINNAGIMKFENLASRRDLADAEATVVTNLLGPIRLTNALVDHLSAQEGAAIINVTSGLAYIPLIDAPTYSATKAAIHLYTVTLREALRGRVEVIELVPPGVRTTLTAGQERRSAYMPLDDYADEVMALLSQQPTPPEILVERVKLQRFAEREGRLDETTRMINERARQAREEAGG